MKKIAIIFSLAASLMGLDFNEIKSQIKTQNISGEFAQTKFLSGFNVEFKSYGKFELSQSELLYDTLSPIAVSIVINERGIFQKSGNQLIKIDQNFDKKLFLSIIKLDKDELEKEFIFKISGDKNNWKIELTPKNLLLKQIFTRILVGGDKFVRKIVLDEVSGDKTVNDFYNVK